jgi:predicted nucleotidyltransferase
MGIADFLLSHREQRLLGLLLLHPQRSFSLTELLAHAGAGRGAGQLAIKHLLDAGVLVDEPVGRNRQIRINPKFPLFPELRSICLKSFGLVEALREALHPLAGAIVEAFVFGSVAAGTDTAGSDIDLMVIGKAEMLQVLDALAKAEKDLGRPVHLTLYSPAEWRKLKKSDAVVRKILDSPQLKVLPDATPR